MEKNKKIMAVVNTRPDAIKMCPLIKELRSREGISVSVCSTGQHKELLAEALDIFSVVPDCDLEIMREGQDLSHITSAVLDGMRSVLRSQRPDALIVHGDTTGAFAAALAGFYEGIPVYHVEAGLRTYNMRSPFPEEFYRRVISLIAELHFAPTEAACQNLLSEGVDKDKIFVVGNTVVDSFKYTLCARYHHRLLEWVGNDRLVLMTAHRRENIGSAMENIFRAVESVASAHDGVKVIYPMHPNPEVRQTAERILGSCERIRLTEPIDVVDFHNLLSRAYMVLTDSGGIQEEACALGVPTLVARDTTERGEGVSTGGIRLIGTQENEIIRAFSELLDNPESYKKMRFSQNPYGDGTASAQICQILRKKLALFTEL